jgi:ABC-2 type transport system ATP-binding protein
VDVELRRGMWALLRRLNESGVTIILTTHYIEEAEEMADRVGVINKGELLLAEDKHELMKKLGKKQLKFTLAAPLSALPPELGAFPLTLGAQGNELHYTFDVTQPNSEVSVLLGRMSELGIGYKDLNTHQSSLEDIFVDLVAAKVASTSHG